MRRICKALALLVDRRSSKAQKRSLVHSLSDGYSAGTEAVHRGGSEENRRVFSGRIRFQPRFAALQRLSKETRLSNGSEQIRRR